VGHFLELVDGLDVQLQLAHVVSDTHVQENVAVASRQRLIEAILSAHHLQVLGTSNLQVLRRH